MSRRTQTWAAALLTLVACGDGGSKDSAPVTATGSGSSTSMTGTTVGPTTGTPAGTPSGTATGIGIPTGGTTPTTPTPTTAGTTGAIFCTVWNSPSLDPTAFYGYGPRPLVTGTVVGQGPVSNADLTASFGIAQALCPDTRPWTYLHVEDAAGDDWFFGWTPLVLGGTLPYTEVPVTVGDTVEVLSEDWGGIAGGAEGLSVRRSGDLRFLSRAWDGHNLPEASFDGVNVGLESVAFTYALAGCGPLGMADSWRISVEGDGPISVDPDAVLATTHGGVPMWATNGGTREITAGDCGDGGPYNVRFALWAQ